MSTARTARRRRLQARSYGRMKARFGKHAPKYPSALDLDKAARREAKFRATQQKIKQGSKKKN